MGNKFIFIFSIFLFKDILSWVKLQEESIDEKQDMKKKKVRRKIDGREGAEKNIEER